MAIIDLKSHPFLRMIPGKTLGGDTDVYRSIDFQAGYGLHTAVNLSSLRCKVPGQLQRKNIYVSRSVSLHGVCPDRPPGKSARYRDLPSLPKQETLPHGYPRTSLQINARRCQRKARLAHLCRACSTPHRYCQRPLPEDQFLEELDETVYALDSTTIDLCLSVFPWAVFRKKKGAVKLHTLLDLRGNIPTFIHISDGKLHDVNALDLLPLETGAYYVMDRGYLDFQRLYTFNRVPAFFVTRAKANTQYKRRYSHTVDKTTGLRCDQTITLSGYYTSKYYPLKFPRN
jgi:hypothetical protein